MLRSKNASSTMPKSNHRRSIVSKNARRLPSVAVAWLAMVTIFACLEASTSAKDKLVADAWMINSLVRIRLGTTRIDMGKGFNRARNKQAELAKKMAIAKSQNQKANNNSDTSTSVSKENKDGNPKNQMEMSTDDTQPKGSQQRDDFERLLRTTKGAIPSADDAESAYIAPIEAGSKTKQKKVLPQTPNRPRKTKKEHGKKGDDEKESAALLATIRIEAQRRHFESLLDVTTKAPLGPIGAAALVPWVPPFLKKGLILLVDPRSNSKDLRRTMSYHSSSSLSPRDNNNVDICFVTADSVGETLAWLKRNKIHLEKKDPPAPTKLKILCDPKWSFMKEYEIVGDDAIDHRWSMVLLAFDTKGNLVRMERNIKASLCSQLVSETIKDLENAATD